MAEQWGLGQSNGKAVGTEGDEHKGKEKQSPERSSTAERAVQNDHSSASAA